MLNLKTFLFLYSLFLAHVAFGYGTEAGKDLACKEKIKYNASHPSTCHMHYYDARNVCYFGADHNTPLGSIEFAAFQNHYCPANAQLRTAQAAAGINASSGENMAQMLAGFLKNNSGVNAANANTGPLAAALHRRERLQGMACQKMAKNCIAYCGNTSATIVKRCKDMAAESIKMLAVASQAQQLEQQASLLYLQSKDSWKTEVYQRVPMDNEASPAAATSGHFTTTTQKAPKAKQKPKVQYYERYLGNKRLLLTKEQLDDMQDIFGRTEKDNSETDSVESFERKLLQLEHEQQIGI